MDENEIKQALERGRLPITIGDKVLMTIYAIGAISIIVMGLIATLSPHNPNFQNPIPLWIGFSLIMIFLGYLVWRDFFYNKQLLPFKSSLTYEQKTQVLENLLNEPQIKPISRYWITVKSNFYGFNYKQSWWCNYSVKVIYDESCYYVNSIIGAGKSATFSMDNANEIIEKIKKLEAEV